MSRLSHLDEQGRARMVDVGGKPVTERECVARGSVRMAPETLARIRDEGVAKGDVLATARLAGILAAKRTSEWIPLAHPLPPEAPGSPPGPLSSRATGESAPAPPA